MNSKEIEERSGLMRSNIRFYEQEGLLQPQRLPNGYRDYSEEDLQQLLKIRLLRTVGLPLEEIRAVQAGALPLRDALADYHPALEEEAQSLTQRQALCERLTREEADYATLDAERYLQSMDASAPPQEDAVPSLQAPWQRFFARMFDLFFCHCLLLLTVPLFVHTSPATQTGSALVWLAGVLDVGLMFLVEPLLLHWWGTTPGKWLMGLEIRDGDGAKLSLAAAYSRTGWLLWYGLGLGVPLVDLWRLWRSYDECTNGKALPWEEGESQTRRDGHIWRFALPFVCGAVLLGLLVTAVQWSAMPPHRGELTRQEFVGNYNALARFHGLDTAGWRLTTNGSWGEIPDHEVYASARWEYPDVTFTERDGRLVGVEFLQAFQDDAMPFAPQDEVQLAILAYIQGRGGLVQQELKEQLEAFAQQPFQPFSAEIQGITIHWEVDMEGYLDAGIVLVPTEKDEMRRCSMRLTLHE